MMRPVLGAVLSAALVLARAAPAHADSPAPAKSEAAERFDRAIRLVDAGDLSGGLAEFQRAYALAPSPVVLYDLGLVSAELQRPVEAARALEKALSDASALKPEERERARKTLAEQGEKIGRIELIASIKEGSVEVDNIEVAKLPLPGPLEVSSGPHVVGVISSGYAPARREVVVAGKETVKASLELVAIEGLLAHIALQCRVPAADVFVDGERVGKTPLIATVSVPPGTHRVEVRRAGYAPVAQSITLEGGARGDLTITPAIDAGALASEGGYLAIATSETQAVVSIDGTEIGLLAGPIQLPKGPHRLHVERGGFLPAERDIEVPLGRTASVPVTFEPTPDTRVHYVASAERRRTWSWVTIGAGAALATGGLVLAVVEQRRVAGAQSDLDAVNADFKWMSGRTCDHSIEIQSEVSASCDARLNDANSQLSDIKTLRTVGAVTAGVGAAALATGVALLLTGDDPHKYDERPSDLRGIAWRVVPSTQLEGLGVSVVGTF
jgi:hypothetical protein